jgi:hypothetical protein
MKPQPSRMTRPKLARSGPRRDFSALLKGSNVTDRPTAQADAESGVAAGTLNGAVAEGVRLGYSVIQEQIRQGQRLAQQISGGLGGIGAVGGSKDLAHLAQRMLHFSADLGAMLVDLSSVLWPTMGPRAASSIGAETAGASPNGAAGTAAVTVEVEANRRTKVMLDLRLGTGSAKLTTPGLHSLGGNASPLTEIAFGFGEDHSPELRVKIPPDQPAGTYSGVIIDMDTHEPRGTLSVRVSD